MKNEDKVGITFGLQCTLQQTKLFEDLKKLTYVKDIGGETVIAVFQNGREERIDVTADSGIALISDVIKALRA